MTIVNTYLLAIASTPKGAGLMAVLTQGAVEDYAVYEGIVPLDAPREASAEFVAHEGLKCNYARALTYFPYLPREKYRA